jgi:hypothetical protein
MEFFYFRVEEFFIYGGDYVAENLIRSKNEVWVHSSIYDFHGSINLAMQSTSLGDLDSYIAQLDSYIKDLKQ